MSSRKYRPGNAEIAIRVRDLVVEFDDKVILDHLDLDIYRGEILGLDQAPQGRASRC